VHAFNHPAARLASSLTLLRVAVFLLRLLFANTANVSDVVRLLDRPMAGGIVLSIVGTHVASRDGD
jgi:hypothetical protein